MSWLLAASGCKAYPPHDGGLVPSLYRCFQMENERPVIDSLHDVTQILINVVQILLAVAGVAAVIMIVVGGIMFIASNGEQDRIAHARNILVNAVTGLIIALASYAIVGFVAGVFG